MMMVTVTRFDPSAWDDEAMDADRQRVIDPQKVKLAMDVIGRDDESVRRWAARFDMLSDTNRLRLLMAIHGAPDIAVSDLAAATGMSDTAVSQALRLLRSQGWVTTRREGRSVLYSLDDKTVHDMLHMLGAGHGRRGHHPAES